MGKVDLKYPVIVETEFRTIYKCPDCGAEVDVSDETIRFMECPRCGCWIITPAGEKWLDWRDKLIADYKAKKEEKNGQA